MAEISAIIKDLHVVHVIQVGGGGGGGSSAPVTLDAVQDAVDSAVRSHGTNDIRWNWDFVGGGSLIIGDTTTGFDILSFLPSITVISALGSNLAAGKNLFLKGGSSNAGTGDPGSIFLLSGTLAGNGGDVAISGGAPFGPALRGRITHTARAHEFEGNISQVFRIDGATGEIQIGTDPGVLGQIFTSQGPGVAPIWQSPAAAFPLLAPDGSCAAPSYSFATDPTSGLLYDVGVPAVTLEFDGCSSFVRVGDVVLIEANSGDFIEIGASITIATDASTPIVLSADTGDAVLTIHQDGEIRCATAAVERLRIDSVGAWQLAGVAGLAGQVITTNGPGLPPTWQAATTAFPLLAPDGSCAAPSYSFTSSPDSGMFYTGTAVRISDDNCGDYIEVGASINIIGAAGSPGSDINIFAGDAATAGSISGGLFLQAGGVPTWFTPATIRIFPGQALLPATIVITGSELLSAAPTATTGGTIFIEGGGTAVSGKGGGFIRIRGGAASDGLAGDLRLDGGESLSGQAGNAVISGGIGSTAALSGDITFRTGVLQTLRMTIDRFGAVGVAGALTAGTVGVAGALTAVTVGVAGALTAGTVTGTTSMDTPSLTVTANAGLKASSQVDGAGASVGTLTNAPSAGNPTFWVPWFVNGIMRHVPAW